MNDLFGNEKMLALSWKQPYAELMLHDKIETRTWSTNYRGLVLICVSIKEYSVPEIIKISGFEQYQYIKEILGTKRLLNGQAIAIGRLIHCRKMSKMDESTCFAQFNPDLYCHLYDEVKAIEPFQWKGSQGWKTVNKDIINQIKYL